MKYLVLASIFCLTLSAQAPQLVYPQPNIGVWSVVQGIQKSNKQHELLVPRELKIARAINLMKSSAAPVCSVPLLEAHADANDPGIATAPRDNSVPIRQARVPAPPCKK